VSRDRRCRRDRRSNSCDDPYVEQCVPEQGGRNLISADPLAPGCVYTAAVAADGSVGMYRVEVSVSTGYGKLRMAGGISGTTKESINRAFSSMLALGRSCRDAMDRDECGATRVSNFAQTRLGQLTHNTFFL
jgi:predicted ATP-dependent Lon-type protease